MLQQSITPLNDIPNVGASLMQLKATRYHHSISSSHFWLDLLQLKGGFPKHRISQAIRVGLSKNICSSISGIMNGVSMKDEEKYPRPTP